MTSDGAWQFDSSSIQTRLALVSATCTTLALLFAVTAFMFLEVRRIDESQDARASALSEAVGLQTAAALLFDEPEEGREVLTRLADKGWVVAAAVYRANGELFASWARDEAAGFEPPPLGDGPGSREDGDIVEKLRVDGRDLGAVLIRSDSGEIRQLVFELLGISVGLVLIAGVFGWLGARQLHGKIVRRLKRLAMASHEIAKGRLSSQVDDGGDDEIGQLATAFEGMRSGLNGLLQQTRGSMGALSEASVSLADASGALVTEAADQLEALDDTSRAVDSVIESIRSVADRANALDEGAAKTIACIYAMNDRIAEITEHMASLAGSIEMASSGVAETAASTRQMAAGAGAMETSTGLAGDCLRELSHSVVQTATNAEESLTASAQASRDAAGGSIAVRETVKGMQEIDQSFTELAAIVSELSTRSVSIDRIIGVNDSILDEIGLLALNASIIAAQAGEQGRPFAVVAQELKDLVERTSHSSAEVRTELDAIRGSISGAVTAARGGAEHVRRGVHLAGEADEALSVIGESSARSSERVGEIAAATTRQNSTIERADTAMADLGTMAREIAEATRQQEAASGHIAIQMEEIQSLGRLTEKTAQSQVGQSQEISAVAEAVAKRASEILDATQLQATAGAQIGASVETLREAVRRTADRARRMDGTVADLSGRSEALETELGRFTS